MLNLPPNGWGQHIDKMGRQSHFLLLSIKKKFGAQETNLELDHQFSIIEHRKIRSVA